MKFYQYTIYVCLYVYWRRLYKFTFVCYPFVNTVKSALVTLCIKQYICNLYYVTLNLIFLHSAFHIN